MSPRRQRKPKPDRIPTMAEVTRPAQLIGFAAIIAVFTGLVVIVATREWWLGAIGFGVAFVIGLVVLAMFVLSVKPSEDEKAELAEQDASQGGTLPVLDAHDKKRNADEDQSA